ncbi:DUF1937 family protein [Pseudomonas sp. GX19020]|uniref:DUF1937 family protein n=1 Tax=Pseudomonas sp. GX19020 TaxID=2942277 RepID=UPI002018AB3C|nr:DUF1937 family protein [Pseudomonas sp. GX19020]MCL4069019.1 DUF1937 family protein [Pseudomonas sp. GX19020]
MTLPAIARAALSVGRIDWGAVMMPKGRWSALVETDTAPARVAQYASGQIYLAAPYPLAVRGRQAEWKPALSERIALLAAREILRLMQLGVSAVCPVQMRAGMCIASPLVDEPPPALDPHVWQDWAIPMLAVSRMVVVPDIPGWSVCPEVWATAVWALNRNIPLHIYAGEP